MARCTRCKGVGYYQDKTIRLCDCNKSQFIKLVVQRKQNSNLEGWATSVTLDSLDTEGRLGTKAMVAAARQIIETRQGFLVVNGSSGNGKTHMLHGVANALMERYATPVLYYEAFGLGADMGRHIRDNTIEDWVDKLCRVPVLLLNDIDKYANLLHDKDASDTYTQSLFFHIVDARLNAYLHRTEQETIVTIVTMNSDFDVLMPALQSRLRDGRITRIKNIDNDYRSEV